MRAVIYARFSSENQRQASITDQIEVCTRYVDKQGWAIVGTYSDAAASGASRFRPGYQKLLSDLDRHLFDIVVVEALDRLGRKLSDIADLHDRSTFAGIKIHAANVGEIGAMHIGMLGTMAQLYLSDLREKTWRGQLGRALQGKLPGGKAYGYAIVGPDTGERRIKLSEARIVGRIFREFAEGRSPRAIARKLNFEGIPGPEGRTWGDTTIRGQRSGFRRQRERVCRSGIGPKQGGHDEALHDPWRYRYGVRFASGQGFGRRVAGPISERDRGQQADECANGRNLERAARDGAGC
jgi:site-specific DNA recombinase